MKNMYHGSTHTNLQVLKPFKRYTPGDETLADSIPPRIYATYLPAYAVAHSFPWSSEDGIDIAIEHDRITLIVPKNNKWLLNQEICIYTLPDTDFVKTEEEKTGLTYHSEHEVTPVSVEHFKSVLDAMEQFSGKVKYI